MARQSRASVIFLGPRRARSGGGGRRRRGRSRRNKRGVGGFFKGFLSTFTKPSKVVAIGGAVAATGELVFTPLPNGDSWMKRILVGYSTYKTSNNAVDILGQDPEGNNAITIGIAQIKQNIVPAVITAGIAGGVAAVLRRFGM